MTANKEKTDLSNSPFPGIDPYSYSESNIFFAREQDSRTLLRTMVIHRGTLLYSTSGFGKSSLINAGLLPKAIAEGFQVEKLRVQPKDKEEIIVERISEKARKGPPFLQSIFSSDENEEHVVLSVDSFSNIVRNKAVSTRPLLIFDQFEEWFTLFEESVDSKQYKAAKVSQEKIRDTILSFLWDTKLPIKVLLVFREDYLAKLTPFFNRYPNLPDQYLRLDSLKGVDIKRIIRGPFEEYPEIYQRDISEALAEQIQREFEGRGGDEPVQLSEVQIVCRDLYESGKTGKELEAYFQESGKIQGILEKYLDSTLNSLSEEQQDPAIGLLSRMVTPVGTRNVISEDDLLSRVSNDENIPHELLKETLQNIENETKLVRRERRREVYYYEIVSEFLVEWIQKKSQERENLKGLKEKEREIVEIQNLRHRERNEVIFKNQTLRLIIGLIALSFPLVVNTLAERIPNSISWAYHTNARDYFVGLLFVLGAFLISYFGNKRTLHREDVGTFWKWANRFWSGAVNFRIWERRYEEDLVSSAGGLGALVAAVIPTSYCMGDDCPNSLTSNIHYIGMTILFLTAVYFCLVAFREPLAGKIKISKSIGYSGNSMIKRRYQIYSVCGWGILAILLITVVASLLPFIEIPNLAFWGESMAWELFGISWITASQILPFLTGEEERERIF